MGVLDRKVALITEGARGQGQALASSREGADVVVTGIWADIPTVPGRLGTREGLDKTAARPHRVRTRRHG
jgi:NAD(P)-dependent dehydrogenase (short-subunit alcohol dehydrogenase family)